MHIDRCNPCPCGKHLFQRCHKPLSGQGRPGKSAQQRIDQPQKTMSGFGFSHRVFYENVLSLLKENEENKFLENLCIQYFGAIFEQLFEIFLSRYELV